MKTSIRNPLIVLTATIVPTFVFGAELSTINVLQTSMSSALDGILKSLTGICVTWLSAFLLAQMIWTQINGLVTGADLERAWGKLLAGLLWGGFCFYVYENGADFIRSIANYILGIAAGLTGQPFSPSYPIETGLASTASLLRAYDQGQSILGSLNPFPAFMMVLVSLVILAMSTLIAFRIFMIIVETKIVIALSPISFALMGMNALRDQGFAPIKYLIAMGYRILILGAVLAAMATFSAALVDVFANLPPSSSPDVWPPIWAASIGYTLLGVLAWNSNSIAGHLASGSSAMTTSDVGGPAAMASAVGGAVGAALGSMATAAANPITSMSNWMSSAASSGGISNASTEGSGSSPSLLEKPEPAGSMSISSDKGTDNVSLGDRASLGQTETNSSKFEGTPNPPVSELQKKTAAREARIAARGESQTQPSIGGVPVDASMPKPPSQGKGMLEHLGNAHDQAMRSPAPAVHVSLNTHAGD